MPYQKKYDAIIIGAGLTGLTTAYLLQKKGMSVLVLDKKERPGGVIHSQSKDGFVFETGPNTGVLTNSETEALFKELGDDFPIEIANKSVNKRLIWKKDAWHNLPMSPIGGLLTPLFSWKDKFGILLEPFRAKGTHMDESLADLIKRRLGQSYLDYAVDPFVLGIYAGDPNHLVTQYAFPRMHALEQEHGSFTRGMIAKIFGKKEPGYTRPSRKIFSGKGGLSTLVEALVKKIGPENIVLNCEHLHIAPLDEGFELQGRHDGDPLLMDTPHVITTTGSYTLPQLFPTLRAEDQDILATLSYAKVAQITLGFKQWTGRSLNAFGGLVPSVENKDILGVLFMSSMFENRAPKGGALLAVFVGGMRNEEILEKSDADLLSIVANDLQNMLGIKHFAPDLVNIARHNHAIAQYGRNTGKRQRVIEQLQKQYPGLHIAGNMWGGIGMADRIKQAYELVETIHPQ